MQSGTSLVLASRKSPLALAQTHQVQSALATAGFQAAVKTFSTPGDETARPLTDIGGKELFVNTLRRALQDRQADIAVHSLKDTAAAACKEFACICGFAEDVRDVFVSDKFAQLSDVPDGGTVGTCSPRRMALLREHFPRVRCDAMRGNVQTRLQKMKNGECDGLILAAAGLHRLGLKPGDDFGCLEYLPAEVFIPAPGQGVLALECLSARSDLVSHLAAICAQDACVEVARAFAAEIGGDCRTALGALAVWQDQANALSVADDGDDRKIHFRGFYAGKDMFCKVEFCETKRDAVAAAKEAAQRVLQEAE